MMRSHVLRRIRTAFSADQLTIENFEGSFGSADDSSLADLRRRCCDSCYSVCEIHDKDALDERHAAARKWIEGLDRVVEIAEDGKV